MTEIEKYTFPVTGDEVRVVRLNDEPWFVAKDVCDILDFRNTRTALNNHVDQEDRNTVPVQDGIRRGNPNQAVINESGLYALIFGSKKPVAKKFKRWVTSEVLPSIRKTGAYISPQASSDQLLSVQEELRSRIARAQQAEANLTLLRKSKGLVDDTTLARYAMAELESVFQARQFTISDYLYEQGFGREEIAEHVKPFGVKASAFYVREFGQRSPKLRGRNGMTIAVAHYKESERYIVDEAWAEYKEEAGL